LGLRASATSAYVREAAILRAVFERTERGEATFGKEEIQRMLRQAREDDGGA
jgi:hypothetical protein